MGKKLKKRWHQLIVLFVFTNIFFLAVDPIYGKEPEWLIKLKKIEVFKSTKAEVEKIFDNPKVINYSILAKTEKNGWSERIEYKTEDGELEAVYSTGKCSETNSTIGYNVDKDVVVQLKFYPHNPIPYENVGYDLKKFEYVSVSDMWETYIFTNNKLGVKIFIVNKKIENIEFGIAEKNKKLHCKNILDKGKK